MITTIRTVQYFSERVVGSDTKGDFSSNDTLIVMTNKIHPMVRHMYLAAAVVITHHGFHHLPSLSGWLEEAHRSGSTHTAASQVLGQG